MQFSYDYGTDTVSTYGNAYPLKDIRVWLTENYPDLVKSHFIKVISISGVNHATFDWFNIYQVAEDTGILQNYFQSIWKEANK
jgi:hypothetical protein